MELIIIFFSIIVYNILYIRLNQNKSIFFLYYFNFFLFYSLILILFDFIFLNYFVSSNYLLIFLVLYFIIFICGFLTISLCYLESPSNVILNFLAKKKSCTKNEIVKKIKKEKIIEKRLNDLIIQNILIFDKNKKTISLSVFGLKIAFFLNFTKKLFNIKTEG